VLEENLRSFEKYRQLVLDQTKKDKLNSSNRLRRSLH